MHKSTFFMAHSVINSWNTIDIIDYTKAHAKILNKTTCKHKKKQKQNNLILTKTH